jgi:hypothetical protein
MSKQEKYVFLSHSSEDKETVEKIANNLTQYNLPLFFDKWEIKVGDSIVEKINLALGNMTDLILVLSSNSVQSNWVKKELSTAIMKKLQDNSVNILPIVIEKCNIPDIINDYKYADLTKNYDDGFLDLIDSLGLTITKGGHKIDVKAYVKSMMYDETMMRIIQQAGGKHKLLWLEAREEDGTMEPRVVEPYSFKNKGKGGNLLFYAWDVRKNGIRGFRVDRIKQVTELEETFRARFPVEFDDV